MKNSAYKIDIDNENQKNNNFKILKLNHLMKKRKKKYKQKMILVSVSSCLLGGFIMFLFNFLVGKILFFELNNKIIRIDSQIKEIKNINY